MTAPDIQARLVEGGSRELDDLVLRAVGFRWNGRLDGWSEPGGALVVKENPTTSVDAALALAERVLGATEALGILYAVIDHVGSNGLALSKIAPLFCAAILKAKALQDGRDG